MAAKAYYACLALLFFVGTQLNSCECKSVDGTFKDDHYNRRLQTLNKRQAEEEDNEETTTISSEDNSESDNEEETTAAVLTTTQKPLKKRKPLMKKKTVTTTTTTEPNDDESESASSEESKEAEESESEEESTPTIRPQLMNKSKPKNHRKSKPNVVSPSISDRINSEDEEEPIDKSNLPKQPASNLLPPMLDSYFPQNFNSFQMPNMAFPPWGFNPVYASPPMAYDYPRPTGPAFSDSKTEKGSSSIGVGNGVASASASAGAGGSGGKVSTSTSFPAGGNQNPGSFVSIRGSFPASDDESVAIEVNGPVSPGQTYMAPHGGYAATGSFAPNSYSNVGPNGGFMNPVDYQLYFNQYFAALQAQQMAFQQQLQAQIEAQRRAGGAFAISSASITNDQGMVDPNSQVYVNTNTSPNGVSPSTSITSRSGSQSSKTSGSVFLSTSNKNHNSIWDQSNQVDSNFAAYGNPSSYSMGPQSASASANLGPNGGFQAGQISPAAPGIFSRFAEDVPAPSGSQYGVFSSSSSSSSTDSNGKQVSHKSATVGINDNGKISIKTVHDP